MEQALFNSFAKRTAPLRDSLGGIVPDLFEIPRLSGYPSLYAFSTDPHGLAPLPSDEARSLTRLLPKVSGAGISTDAHTAEIRAVGEGIERYCMSMHSPDQFIRATADGLGSEALDLDLLARCSPNETGISSGYFSLPRKDVPIRWVRGMSLIDGRPVWVPTVMVYLYCPPETRQENFWIAISTGCAFHQDLRSALISGICEVIERDSLSLTWLHQLPLPRLEIGSRSEWPEDLRTLMDRTAQGGLRHEFFDATSDLGVSTVYTLQLSDHTHLLSNLVVSASRLRAVDAVARTVEEGCSSRLALDGSLGSAKPNPVFRERPELLYELEDCALYYAEREQRDEFAFLLEGKSTRSLKTIPDQDRGSPAANLTHLLNLFRGRNIEVVAVDLTTPEVRDAGFWVVRVLIPQLMPMSPIHGVRFLDTPRLYDAPRAMGYGDRSLRDITRKPQPFA